MLTSKMSKMEMIQELRREAIEAIDYWVESSDPEEYLEETIRCYTLWIDLVETGVKD